ncbi:P-loop containing nucleoside triphosphate hydrolase protein [Eremomyces bilateralis CBS 781.70]|uniref:Midasin n=1 Tax=Eremomyces bilateralis CBS 781.70 TaxID=1392243 RepID=A0A6G1G3Z7_9PEZI|nr:P-loop containing nucleoside triphosphate hydrolase protein [Eremomyces bilateralis CBS 781.70]KAF1812640.1 P-loop containing nucleoside triphosphate hydrolase protein [Eremomyces bilateralis CBS 781.70]
MDCSRQFASLLLTADLPEELKLILREGSIPQILEATSAAALLPRYTDALFLQLQPIFAELCCRWNRNQLLYAIPALGRILPFAPHLPQFISQPLFHDDNGRPLRLPTLEQTLFQGRKEEDLRELLLGLFRLLRLDDRTYSAYIHAANLQLCLSHSSIAIRYLATRVLCLFAHAADAATAQTLHKYTAGQAVKALWDGKEIDYTYLNIWERKRFESMSGAVDEAQKLQSELPSAAMRPLFVRPEDMSPHVVPVQGVLLPRIHKGSMDEVDESFVAVPSAISNLASFARTILGGHPTLLTGLPGSGKTFIINYLAELMGKRDTMVTLHLNEQTDAKLLLGLYTTDPEAGTFAWAPGVLTTAVKEGRWLVIEDLDHAPDSVISTLLPLLERGELHLPSRGEVIRAAEGFRIIATIRTIQSSTGTETISRPRMVGWRFWERTQLCPFSLQEAKDIIQTKYPELVKHSGSFTTLFERVTTLLASKSFSYAAKNGSIRPFHFADLLKWCSRMSWKFKHSRKFDDNDLAGMFLDAVDIFAASMRDKVLQDAMVENIAIALGIDPQLRDHLLGRREIPVGFPKEGSKASLRVGRIQLPVSSSIKRHLDTQALALNRQTRCALERISAAVMQSEPLLLVGETGAGKTSTVQYLSNCSRATLHVFNLSQQSEGSDLLGSFKPVSIRAMMQPLKARFEDLFFATFGQKANEGFLTSLSKSFAKGQWSRVFKLWLNAIDRVQQAPPSREHAEISTAHPRKKIKTGHSHAESEPATPSYKYVSEWEQFAAEARVLEQKMKSSRSSPLFAFVEGNLVKAARNGHWVLLDEINLAPMETLEALAELLGGGYRNERFLMLSESGEVQRIEAHRDFRLFAAMNPATDVGKRDLPGGIRSRFTEFYFESPDRDPESLLMIVSSYLRDPHFDKKSAPDAAGLYQKIQGLVESNQIVDGAGRRPHYSLRSLTRALRFAALMKPCMSGREALNEGFQMSFSTCLDNTSAMEVTKLISESLLGPKSNRTRAQRAFKAPNDGTKHVQIGARWLRCGDGNAEDVSDYIITPFIQSNLDNLVRAVSARRYPILLQGPTSSGKTSMIEYLARRSGNKFVRINNHEHTDLQEYLGSYVSKGGEQVEFQDGALVQAMRKGYWIVLDELNLAPGEVLEALNRLLDDNRELFIPETQETVLPHPNFVLFATQNPAGLYGGRKHLSRAFRNRFLEMHFDDIPTEELSHILYQRCSMPQSWANRIVAVYQRLSQLRQQNRLFEQKSFATLRDLFRWGGRPASTIEELAENGYMLLAERVRKEDERAMVKTAIEECMSKARARVTIDLEKLYNGDLTNMQIDYPRNNAAFVDTSAMRRMITLLAHAFRNHEPILLIGETGCGKTTACQVMALLKETLLLTVNAHQNTEAGDLLGSQRPIRNRASIESDLVAALTTALDLQGVSHPPASTLSDFLHAYDISAKDQLPKDLQKSIEANRLRHSQLFEWSDGPLVQAMREGNFFLLDEISLADDSVLERLNSVLEPKREIYLAEKGGEGQSIQGADGFQFMATMNPGGDYGKRELSPALRNRFTEIWIPNMTDQEDLLVILEARLAAHTRPYGSRLLQFAKWFGQQYNTGMTESISLRKMLGWVQFVNSFPETSIQEAIVHGAALVFIDALGANPAGLISVNQANVESERLVCLNSLSELFQFNATLIYFVTADIGISNTAISVGPFQLPRTETPADNGDFSMVAPTTRSNIMRIARAMRLPRPILIEGAPGVGKTTLVLELARLLGKRITRINLSEQTDLMDLFGSDVPSEGSELGKFVWHDAPFLTAMKRGDWVLLDEMNLASQPVLEGLNACLDHRGEAFVPELNQTFAKHPGFMVFAAQNPHHQGNGRKGLPASFVDRFTVVYAESMVATDFELICTQSFSDLPQDSIEKVVRFSEEIGKQLDNRRFGTVGGPWEFNLRDVRRWLELLQSQRQTLPHVPLEHFFNLICLQRFRTGEDAEKIRQLCLDVFGPPPAPAAFHNLSQDRYQVGLALLPRSLDTAESSTPITNLGAGVGSLLESIVFCIDRAWPVLLTGPSGCGKSHVIRYLSAMAGAKLVNLSLNADTDSSDLIGGYEQYDAMRHIATAIAQLRSILQVRVIQICLQTENQSSPSPLVTNLFELLSDLSSFPQVDLKSILRKVDDVIAVHSMEDIAPIASELWSLALEVAQQQHARFEWVDGIVIEAMSQGYWLVLDQVNLCSPSVLDRLNSLLEPGRTLSVSEHSTATGESRVIRAHPSFRIFMTMDPLHGELSRAMRNRSVELHLQKAPLQSSTRFHQNLESLTYRLERFGVLPYSQKDVHSKYVVELVCEHLSPHELQHSEDFLDLMSQQHVVEAEQTGGSLFLSLSKALGSSITRWNHLQEGSLQTFGQRFSSAQVKIVFLLLPFRSCLRVNQPINALNNEISLYNQARSSSAIEYEFDLFDLVGRVAQFHSFLLQVRETLGSKPVTQLELSLALADRKPSAALQLSRIAEFLFGIDHLLTSMLPSMFNHIPFNANTPFDLGLFNCLTFLGRSLVQRLSKTGGHLGGLGQQILSLSTLIDSNGGMQSGLGLDRIWNQFRPIVPPSTARLQALLELESVSDQLDSVMNRNYANLQLLTNVRNSMLKTLSGLWKETEGDHERLVSLIRSEMMRLTEVADPSRGFGPYFADEFREMLRFVDDYEFVAGDPGAIQLAVLSGVRTKDVCLNDVQSNQLVRPLASLNKITGGVSEAGITNRYENLAIKCLAKLTILPDMRLKHLKGMLVEMQTMGQQLARNPGLLCSSRMDSLDRLLRSMFDRIVESNNCTQLPPLENTTEIQPEKTRSRFLNPVSRYLEARRSSSCSLHEASSAWVSFGLACIYITVPNVEYDPATREMLQLDRFVRMKNDLMHRIGGVETYLAAFGASDSNLRLTMLQSRLALTGEYSATLPRLPRPKKSQMHLLQRDFNTLLVLSRGIEASFLNSTNPQVDETALNNLAQISFRLKHSYRHYEDITFLVNGFIHCLMLGLILAKEAKNDKQVDDIHPCKSLQSVVPLLGDEATRFDLRNYAPMLMFGDDSFISALLQVVSFHSCVQDDFTQSDSNGEILHTVFRSVDQRWASKLSSDQDVEAARTKWYAYRGAQHLPETEEEELEELFPLSEEQEGANPDTISGLLSSRRLCDLHRALFLSNGEATEQLISLLHHMNQCLARDELSQDGISVPSATVFPLLVRKVNELIRGYSSDVSPSNQSNFYSGANVSQARKFLEILDNCRRRFQQIGEAWPDHAVPIEVISLCDEFDESQHDEPLAKLIAKAEKIHRSIHRWQQVTSREYSAAGQYDTLTTLIIDWRRLELGSWAGLFDDELKASQEKAKEWWFLGLRNIVILPEGLVMAGETSKSHLADLLSGVHEFLSTAPFGQFTERLRILSQFRAHLDMRSKHVKGLAGFPEGLSNILNFYALFEGHVQNYIKEHRSVLEKEIKTVIQLASWKDQNIDSLEQSSKTSHRKLLRIVKKLRTVLNEPVSSIVKKGPALQISSLTPKTKLHTLTIDIPSAALPLAGGLGQVEAWESRPMRFQNAYATAQMMTRKTPVLEHGLQESQILEAFLHDLSGMISELQKETPKTLTEENTDEVKFLTMRKRKLLNETIRQLRHFGFGGSLSTATLANQESLAQISTISRPPGCGEGIFDFQHAEQRFFRTLHLAPQIRNATQEHSSDLSREDVQKCATLFEVLLHHTITQRTRSSDVLDSFSKLESNVQALYNMAAASKESKLSKTTAENPVSMDNFLGYLIPVLNVGILNIKDQAEVAQLERGSFISSLQDYVIQLRTTRAEYAALPSLPHGVTSLVHLDWEQKAEKITQALQLELIGAREHFPELTIMVDKIIPWTTRSCVNGGPEQETNDNRIDSSTVESIFEVCDAMLVSIQEAGKAVETFPDSTDIKSWLTKSGQSMKSITAGLHLDSTSIRLGALLESFSRLGQDSVESLGPILVSVLPIIAQFRNISQAAVLRNAKYYSQLCALVEFLAQTFSKLATDGFCNPQDLNNDVDVGAEKLESGTGLGDGDAAGANNISGEIEDEEELEDIEKDSAEKEDGAEDTAEKDAIEMGEDDNTGKISDVSDSEGEDDDKSDAEDDLDEDVGDLDNNDPDAIDEKMWDEAGESMKEEKQKDQKGQRQDETEQADDNGEPETEEGAEEDFISDKEMGEEQDEQRPNEEHDVLDMPEDLDMDGDESTASEDSFDRTIEEDMLPEDSAPPKEKEGSVETEEPDEEGVENPPGQDIDDEMEDEMEVDEEENPDVSAEAEDVDGMDVDEEDEAPKSQPQEQTNGLSQNEEANQGADQTETHDLTTDQEQDAENGPAETVPSTASAEPKNEQEADEAIPGAEKDPDNTRSDGPPSEEVSRFKRLGDVLEKWFNKQVKNSTPQEKQDNTKSDQDMAKAELSHVQEGDEEGDGQALGTASKDQIRALDREQGIDVDDEDEDGVPLSPQSSHGGSEDANMDDNESTIDGQAHSFGPNATARDPQADKDQDADAKSIDDLDLADDMDEQMESMDLEDRTPCLEDLQDADAARSLWKHDEARIRPLALALTEQLRLILEPTLASKMRGDFRTGKRLNIRRIIPYIASGYKRDKIWMRRSIPTRRTYQILLALDDSKSMAENRSWELALESTTLVSTSLNMLEAGELAVVGFGEDVKVVHEFGKPFSNNAGAELFGQFTFQQSKTDILKLLRRSIGILRDSRARQSGSAAELWQLMIVMSDGHCEDHERLRALVRQAQEERVMVVFVVLDAANDTGNGSTEKKSSILNLRSAEFEQDANGETKVVWRNYFDTFPFQWYALVQNIEELPSVLANALRQWFAEVAVTGG